MLTRFRTMPWLVVAFATLGASPAPAQVVDPAADGALETFLVTASVADSVPVGTGITNPRKVTLERDGIRRSAIFKDIDVLMDRTAHAGRWELSFTDRYAYEVAAYRLDRLLGFGLVPVTVLRELDGHEGSLQDWVEDVVTLTVGLQDDREVANFDLLLQRLTLMYVFDSLIGNIDRNSDNVLLNLGQDRFYLIDHSRTFRTTRDIEDLAAKRVVPIPAEIGRRLVELDRSALDQVLGNLIGGAQKKAVLKRRDLVVAELFRLGLMPR